MAKSKMETGDNDLNGWLKSTKTLLKSSDADYVQRCSISIVPEELKKWNEDAYTPRVVSIGPRYKGSREDLLNMEDLKLTCMLSLLHRAGKEGEAPVYFQKCSEAIWELDEQVRESYVADIKLEKHELASIMLVDGCFLLELLISKSKELNAMLPSRLIPPGPATELLKDEDVLSDLVLLENQIPIFVLHDLSRTLFPDVFEENKQHRVTRINDLALSLLGHALPRVQSFESPHFLDVVHFFVNSAGEIIRQGDQISEDIGDHHHAVVDIMDTDQPQRVMLNLNRCALRLLAAGVTIKPPESSNSKFSCFSSLRNCFGGILIRLGSLIVTAKPEDNAAAEDVRGLDFGFKFSREKGKLEIAQLHITKTTKAKWRNVIAWEHRKKRWKSSSHFTSGYLQSTTVNPNGKFTSAALIFNDLICCSDDVQLLKDKKIIVDHVKMSNEELEAFFRAISFGVDHGVVDSSYIKIVDDVNKYSGNRAAFFLIRIWTILWHSFTYRQEWFIKFMKSNYNFIATVLAVLGVVQTVYTVLAYYLAK